MDYSKVKYLKSPISVSELDNGYVDIKKNKPYPFEFVSNEGGNLSVEDKNLFVFIPCSDHINGRRWIPCEQDGTTI